MPPFRSSNPGPCWLLLPVILGACARGDPSPLAPDANQPLKGTYTFTVTLSASCPKRGSWKFRADIDQSGRDLDIKLYEGDFDVSFGVSTESFNHFRGQDQPEGVLFFAPGGTQGDILFWEKGADTWELGQAKGPFSDGRIDALFNGTGSATIFDRKTGCAARDHSWMFVRR